MSSQTSIQTGVSYKTYLQENPTLVQEPSQVQYQVAREFFDKRMNQQPGWVDEKPEVKEQGWQQFRAKYNVPNIQAAQSNLQPRQAPKPVEVLPNPGMFVPGGVGFTQFPTAPAQARYADDNLRLASKELKGITGGYVDPYKPKYQLPKGGELAENIAEFAGQALPLALMGKVMETRFPGMNPIAQGAAEFGLYDFLKSRPENQLDFVGRGVDSLKGAATGAVLGTAGKYLPKAIKGGITKTQELFKPTAAPLHLQTRPASEVIQAISHQRRIQKVMSQPVYKTRAEALLKELQGMKGKTAPLVQRNADKHISKVEAFLKGEAHFLPEEMAKTKEFVKNAPRLGQSKKVSAVVQKAQAKQQNRAANQNPQGAKPSEQAAKPSQGEKQALEAAVKHTGKTVDEILSAKGLKDGLLDIQTNLKAVTTAARNQAGELLQKDPSLKPFNEIKHLLKGKAYKIGGKLEYARLKDGSARLDYVAEETGRSGKAASVTSKGNVKAARTTFTPLGFSTTKNGEVLVKGYNEKGHFATYYLNESKNGSHIAAIGKVSEGKAFRGEYANPAFGVRTFKADDVLGRGARTETGFIKTSEAINTIKDAQQTADQLYATIENVKGFENLKKILEKLRKGGSITPFDMETLLKYTKNAEIKKALCKLLGLPHV